MQTFSLQRPTLWHVPGRPQTLCKCAVNHRSTFTLDASINIIQVDSFKFNVSSWSGSRCAALCHWEQNNAEWAAHLNANETRWYATCRKEPVRLFGRELHLVETFSAHVGPRELCRELCRMSRQILWLTLSEFKFDSQSWTKLSWQTQMIYAVNCLKMKFPYFDKEFPCAAVQRDGLCWRWLNTEMASDGQIWAQCP